MRKYEILKSLYICYCFYVVKIFYFYGNVNFGWYNYWLLDILDYLLCFIVYLFSILIGLWFLL